MNSDSSYSPMEIHDEAFNNSFTEQDSSVTSDDDMTGPEPTSTIPLIHYQSAVRLTAVQLLFPCSMIQN